MGQGNFWYIRSSYESLLRFLYYNFIKIRISKMVESLKKKEESYDEEEDSQEENKAT